MASLWFSSILYIFSLALFVMSKMVLCRLHWYVNWWKNVFLSPSSIQVAWLLRCHSASCFCKICHFCCSKSSFSKCLSVERKSEVAGSFIRSIAASIISNSCLIDTFSPYIHRRTTFLRNLSLFTSESMWDGPENCCTSPHVLDTRKMNLGS